MKSCAEVPARDLSKVITTAPASPVPASSRSLLASSDRRNCGLFGLKKLRGCGSKVTANAGFPWALAHPQGGGDHGAVAQVDAIEIAHGDHGPPGDLGGRGGVSYNGKIRCHFRDSSGIPGFGERGWTVTRRRLPSQAGGFVSKRLQSACARLTGCLTPDARSGGRTAGRAGLRIVCGVSVEWGKRWRLICPCRFWWLMITAP